MTKEEIYPFAHTITKTHNRTEIIFKTGESVIGYFEHNTLNTEQYNQNKWSFVVFPVDEKNKHTIFDGNDFKSITIHTISL